MLFRALCALCFILCVFQAKADFDYDRWYTILHEVQSAALEQKIGARTINRVVQEAAFIPEVVQRDKNQAEFKINLAQYTANAVNPARIKNGKAAEKKYPTTLKKVEAKYGVPKNVLLAFWGMESDYGAFKSQYRISDSFLTLIYDGRREQFFTTQLLALMKIADKGRLDVGGIGGSWAGAMGHFQFIPTTLQQYGVDGNGDGKIDIINSVADAMASAGNYLKKMGWNKDERILRVVTLPPEFDMGLCDGQTKKKLSMWRTLGVMGVPQADRTAGMVCDDSTYPAAYLTYDNFYRVKKWNNSTSYAVAIALLSEKLK